jgi:hypothetical protein
MVDMVNPTVLGNGGSNGIDPTLVALLASGGGGFGGFGNGNRFGQDNSAVLLAVQQMLQNQTENTNVNSILTNLATIQQLIPENEGKVQNALAQAQIALMNQGTQGQLQAAASTSLLTNNIADARHNINDNVHINGLNNANNFAATQMAIAASTAATNQIVREGKDVSEAGFAAAALYASQNNASTQLGIANLGLQAAQNTAAIISAVRDDGDKTRAQSQTQYDATLNRIITTQANEIIELKNDRHTSASGLSITQTVNQAQAQQQQQFQAQQNHNQLLQALALVHQTAHATNGNVIAGNTGAVTTGAQTANPTNVSTI